jgi:hypothetical protein
VSTDRCKAMIRTGWHKYPCANQAKRDGYCGTHHPDAAEKRRFKAEARWAEESRIRNEKYEREEYDRAAGVYCRRRGMKREELV